MILLFFLLPILLNGQDNDDNKVRRVAIGLKAGVPIGIGGSVEIILPVLSNRLAPYLDYSNLKNREIEEVSITHKHLDYGLNLYSGTNGKGLYLAIGRSSSTSDFAYSDEIADSGNTYIGVATTTVDLNMTNFKLGYKVGGLVFAKLEVGYGIGDIPQQLVITGTTEVMGVQMTETSIEDIPNIPGWNENGMLIGSLTVGVSF